MDPGMSAKPLIRPSFQSHALSLHPQSALYRVDFSSSSSSIQVSNNDLNHRTQLPAVVDHDHQLVVDDLDNNYQMDLNNSRYPNNCIPSLMPSGVDPTSVDFRTFFPYIPNEVKHRKRTSRSQLKVLEDVFRKDTKPNAALRKKLAAELDMLPRAVQVWFQNRRAKDKQLRKRASVAIDHEMHADTSAQKSPPPRDTSPNDSSNSSTATEKPAPPAEDCASPEPPSLDHSAESSPLVKVSSSPPLISDSAPSGWHSSSGTPEDIPPHVRPPAFDQALQDGDLYSTRRGSLPTIMPSQPITGPDATQPPPHFPDRRKSMDVGFYRLMHHPFARIAKEKNDALYLPKSPLSPAGSGQANMTRSPPGMAGSIGPIRSTSHSAYPYGHSHPRPALAHRASEPHVFAPSRPQFPPVPEGGPLQAPHIGSRRFSDNRMYALTSRTLSSPIPGPLPTPDFQFGEPSSASPSNASPIPADVESPAHMHSPDMANMLRWSFPRTRETDQDTEDSASFTGLSRFGSVASISGSDSSAMYSDVSSCVAVDHLAYDPNARRGSCASGNFLEMRMSGLNMSSRSSQGSLNEAHLNAAASLAYQHRDSVVRQDHPSDVAGGYTSPTSTASPGGSPHVRHVKDPVPSGLRSETVYEYSPLAQVPEDIVTVRRGSIPAPEPVPHIYIQNSLGHTQGPSYPTTSSDAGPASTQSEYHFRPESGQSRPPHQHHYTHPGNFTPHPHHQSQPGFPSPNEAPFPPGQAEPPYQQQQQSTELQYPPDGAFSSASSTMGGLHADMANYVPPADGYTYASGHAQEPYGSFN